MPSLRRTWTAFAVPLVVMSFVPIDPVGGQSPNPDVGTLTKPVDGLVGRTLPPALALVHGATGQNVTREDVRISVDLDFTKATIDIPGFLVGSGTTDIQVAITGRVELRVISADRIRAALESENAYNISAENATALSEAYLPAEVFRASLTAETVAAFQVAEENALADYLRNSVPEMRVLALKLAWGNVTPVKTLTDLSLTEPPIVVELDAVVEYVRVDSVGDLLTAYLGRDKPTDGHGAYIKQLKRQNSEPLLARNFFAAAAYNQLLNLSVQPGWSVNITLNLPRGFSFPYTNHQVERLSERSIRLSADARDADAAERAVFLASVTQRRAVALGLFLGMLVVGLLVGGPLWFLFARYRLARYEPKVRGQVGSETVRARRGASNAEPRFSADGTPP